MKIDYSPRMSGKTTRLIYELEKDIRNVLLVFSQREAARLISLYPHLNRRIMYWKDYAEKIRQTHPMDRRYVCLVDNADIILEAVIGDYVRIASFTKDEISMREEKQVNFIDFKNVPKPTKKDIEIAKKLIRRGRKIDEANKKEL